MKGYSSEISEGKPVAFVCLLLFTGFFPAAEAWANADVESARVVAQYLNIGLGVTLAGLWVMESIFRGVKVSPVIGLIFLFAAWSAITLGWTPDIQAGIKQIGSLAMCVLLAWIVADVCDEPGKIKRLGYAYTAGTLLLSVTAAANIINGETYNTLFGRYSAAGTDPNNFGIMMCAVIPWVSLFIGEARKVVLKIAGAAILAYTGFLIFSTASRGAIVCAAALGLACFFSYLRRGVTAVKLSIALAIAAAVVIGAIEWLPEESVSRLDKSTAGGEGMDRLDIWSWGIERGFSGLFTGHGAGSFYYLNGLNQAHNVLVQAFVELGILGVLFLLTIWVGQFGCLRTRGAGDQTRHLRDCLLFSFLCVIAGSMFLNWETRKGVFLVYGLIQAYRGIVRKRTASVPEAVRVYGLELHTGRNR
jgi:hypothetical protein